MACAGTHNDLLGLQRLFSLDWTLQLEPANNQMLDRVLKNICVQIMCQPGQQLSGQVFHSFFVVWFQMIKLEIAFVLAGADVILWHSFTGSSPGFII